MFSKITLVDQQIEKIVIDDLKFAYKLNSRLDRIDCSDDVLDPDQDLLDSIKHLLRYYMTSAEYEQWEFGSAEPDLPEPLFTIQIDGHQIDKVIADDLKIVYESNYRPESCGVYGISQPDTELVSSVDQLLQYYMSEPDYKQWKESIND